MASARPAVPIARLADGPGATRVYTVSDAGRPGASHPVALLVGTKETTVAAIPGLPPARDEATDQPLRITLGEGTSRIIPTRGLRRVQIDDPTGAIAEVQPLSDTEVLLLARGPGATTVRVWDDRGRTDYLVTVEPGAARRQQLIQEAVGVPTVHVRMPDQNTAILEGEVASLDQVVRAQRIAEAYVPKVVNLLTVPTPAPAAPAGPSLVEQVQAILPVGEVKAEPIPGQPTAIVLRGKVPRIEDIRGMEDLVQKVVSKANGIVVNLIQLAEPRQVRINARMIDIDETYLRDLGVRWNETLTVGQPLGSTTTGGTTTGGGTTATNLPASEIRLLTPIQATISAIEQNQHARTLAQPSTVVNSGATGNILIGGQIPIPTVVTGFASAGGTTGGTGAGVGTVGQSVMWQPFGITLNIEPVVEPADQITVRLLIEVSAIDRANAATINGTSIPAFTTRRSYTELRLKSGQTLVIGGLISDSDAKAFQKVPFLADIPVLGAFFRATTRNKERRELVLFLTPEALPGPEPPAGLRQLPVLPAGTPLPGGLVSGVTGVGGTGAGAVGAGQAGAGVLGGGAGTGVMGR